MAIDLLIRLLTTGAENAKSDFTSVADSAKKVDSELSKVGDNGGLEKAGGAAKTLGDKLETVRNVGVGLAAVGAVGLVIANGFTQAALEADALGSKMAALLDGAGISEATDQVKALADQLAIAGEGDNDEIAKNIAEAVASGRITMLKQYGIVLSDTAKESIKAAAATSEHAGKMELMNQVMLAGGEAVKILRANSSQAALSLAEMDHRMAELSEGIGLGTSKAKAQLYEGILSPILSIVEASPGLQSTSGYVLAVGGAGLSAAGSILGLTAQVGMTMAAFPGMGAAGVLSLNAITVSAIPAAAAVGKILLVALLAAAALYALDKALHYKEDAALDANIKEGEGKDDASLAIVNESRRKRGLPALAKNTDTGIDPSADINDIRKQYDAMQAAPVMPAVVPSIAPILSSSGASGGATLQPQIDALESKISGTKDKTAKAQLKAHLKSLKQAEKDADYASSVAAMRADSAGDLDKTRADAAQKIAQNKAKIALDLQIERINDLKASGVLGDTDAQNQIARLQNAYEVRNAAMEKDALMRTAQIESQAELASAQAEASTQIASQAKTTMEKARIKANAILEKAKIAASVVGSDIAPLVQKNSPMAAIMGWVKPKTREQELRDYAGMGADSGGGSMFGMASGNYGGQSAFVRALGAVGGSTPALAMAGGAQKGNFNLSDKDFTKSRDSLGNLDVTFSGRFSVDSDGNIKKAALPYRN
jgi:hypothetical protein